MQRQILLLALVLLVASGCDQNQAQLTEAPAEPALQSAEIPGAASLTEAVQDRYILLAKGNKLGRAVAEAEKLGGSISYRHDDFGLAIVSDLDQKSANRLRSTKSVTELMPDVIFEMERPLSDTPDMGQVTSPSNPADAFFFARQWHMRAIGADEAWAAGKTGSSDVTVAILDTGIDYENPDLMGLVDLSRSVSFLPEDDALVDLVFPGKHPITDLDFHGTHVAATVASNAYVGSGVTSQTTLMGVKVCSVYGGCPGSAIFPGLLHAADNGADVINMSLGGSFMKRDYPGYVGFLNQVFNYVRRQGALVVVSAGNSAVDLDHDGNSFKTYCNVPGVACISATGPTNYSLTEWNEIDAPAYYTNYGRSAIDVAAPGGNESYVYAACSQTSLIIPLCQTGNYIIGLGGTSMAAPHVSGLAALLFAEGYGSSQVLARIQQSADDLGQPGTDPYYGKGRINVATALGL